MNPLNPTTSMSKAIVQIRGRVQGVCFRMYTEEEALSRNLTGWVRNLPDGSVEALFEGDHKIIEDMIAWCHQGPPAARVQDVKVQWEPYCGDFPDFRIVR